MDLVYASALVTIIVAAGEDADSPLPGIREGSRTVFQGHVEVGKKLFLMQTAMQLNSRNLANSKWNSRRWTFQERLLSRRAFIFTSDQVYFNCETSTWMEEAIFELEHPKFSFCTQIGCSNEGDIGEPKFSNKAFRTYISQYSERQFSYPADYLPGFLGIIRRMEHNTGESLHWGRFLSTYLV